MRVKVVGTGSSGNAFLINDNLLIDAGLSSKKLKEAIDLSKIQAVLLTHIHGDHFNKTTIRKLFVETDVMFFAGRWLMPIIDKMGADMSRVMEVDYNLCYEFSDYSLSPVKAYHDVENCGWRIVDKSDGSKHFHITDTDTLEGMSALHYDSATIECNHCAVAVIDVIEKAREDGIFCHLSGAINSHLSVQEACEFIDKNKIKKLIPVHIGASTQKQVFEHIKLKGLS